MKKMILASIALVSALAVAAGGTREKIMKDVEAKNDAVLKETAKKEVTAVRALKTTAEIARITSKYSAGKISEGEVLTLLGSDQNMRGTVLKMLEVLLRLRDADLDKAEQVEVKKSETVAFEYLQAYATLRSDLAANSTEAKVAAKLAEISPNILVYGKASLEGFSALKVEIINQLRNGKKFAEAITEASKVVGEKYKLGSAKETMEQVIKCAP